jgi:hypothetical protein
MKTPLLIGLGLGAVAAFLMPGKRRKHGEMATLDPNEPEPQPAKETPQDSGFRAKVVRAAESQLGYPNQTKYAAAALGLTEAQAVAQGTSRLSWCGLFATWAYQQAGATGLRWILGPPYGIASQMARTNDPKPGDLAYIDQPFQHHAIVESVDGNAITTIDGNSTGGLVVRNTRPRSAFTAFYDADSIPRASV